MTEEKYLQAQTLTVAIEAAQKHLAQFDKYVAAQSRVQDVRIQIRANGDYLQLSYSDCFPLSESDIIELYRMKLVQKIAHLEKQFQTL